jgi:hypothetical protein
MKRMTIALGVLALSAATASAQGILSTAKAKAQKAVAASNAQTEAMQRPEAQPQKPQNSAQKATPSSATKAQAPAPVAKGKAGAKQAADSAKRDTLMPPPTIYREMYAYAREGRRDPFVSLLTTNDLRPTMSDLRLTGVLFDHSGRGNSLATLRDITNNAQYRVGVGSTLGRMRVSAIGTESVVFTIEEMGTTRRDSLVLRDSTNKARIR